MVGNQAIMPKNEDCLQVARNRKWQYGSCSSNMGAFVCQSYSYRIEGNTSLSINFSKEQLIFPSFEVSYQYKYTEKRLLDFWQHMRMTSFQLSWFLQDSNGSRLTETKPDKNTPGTWKLANGDPSFDQDTLVRLVDLASIARVEIMTR